MRRLLLAGLEEGAHAALEGVHDGGEGPHQADDTPGRDRPGANVEDVGVADLGGAHVRDELGRREHGGREARAEDLDGGDQHQEAQHTAREHGRRGANPDDVADAQELGRDLGSDRAALEAGDQIAGRLLPEVSSGVEDLVEGPDEEAHEDDKGVGAALLADDEDVRAGGALGIGQPAVLVNDEALAQGDHHEHAQKPAQKGDHEDANELQVLAQEQQGRHGEGHAGGDGLAGRAGGLHDVVLEERGATEDAEDGDGENRDGDARTDGHADLEGQVHRRGGKDDAEHRPQGQRPEGELGRMLMRRDVGLETAVGTGRRGVERRTHGVLRSVDSGATRQLSAYCFL
ncbi:hypothetical protein D3C86_1011180 [compost metagenome]